MAKFYSTKTYGNDKGLSCCFRQWGATHSHCSLLHGYSIGIKIIFECEEYIGPSGIGPGQFKEKTKLAEVRIVDGVGCEKFAEMIYQELENFISVWKDDGTLLNETVRVTSVEVFEHAGNSAIYQA